MDRGHSRGIAAEAAPALNHIAADRSFLHIAVIPLLLAVVVYFILDWTLEVGCEQPRIRGLTQVPGWPVVGSLFFRMQGSQAITFRHWAKMYGTVYQVRLGSKRVVVVNSFDIARELWVDNMRATASRPTSYTFHSILCATQGPTIGTTPWSEEYRTRRRISGKALNQPSVNKYISMIDNECISVVRALAHETSYEEKCEVAPRRFFDTYSINIVPWGVSIFHDSLLYVH
jgi:phenylacetate 2-hydroxylase